MQFVYGGTKSELIMASDEISQAMRWNKVSSKNRSQNGGEPFWRSLTDLGGLTYSQIGKQRLLGDIVAIGR